MSNSKRIGRAEIVGQSLVFDLGFVGRRATGVMVMLIAGYVLLVAAGALLITPYRSHLLVILAATVVLLCHGALAIIRKQGDRLVVTLNRVGNDKTDPGPRFSVEYGNEVLSAGHFTEDRIEIRQVYMPSGKYQHVPAAVSHVNFVLDQCPAALTDREEEGLVLFTCPEEEEAIAEVRKIYRFLGVSGEASVSSP
jgi:hypothetical protein